MGAVTIRFLALLNATCEIAADQGGREDGKTSSSAWRRHSHHNFAAGWPNPNFRDPSIASSADPRSLPPPASGVAGIRGAAAFLSFGDGWPRIFSWTRSMVRARICWMPNQRLKDAQLRWKSIQIRYVFERYTLFHGYTYIHRRYV
jgi:hypothetical protein